MSLNGSDAIYSMLANAGADISVHNNQLAKERSTRSLTLRRTARPTIAGLTGIRKPSVSPRIKLFDLEEYPYLDPAYCVSVFSEGNDGKIRELLSNLTTVYDGTPKLVLNVIQSEDISEPILNYLNESSNESVVVDILNFIGLIYPKSATNQEKFIDDGLAFSLLNYLQSDSPSLLLTTIRCIDAISAASSYARNSVLCLDLHNELIRISKLQFSEELTEASCKALYTIFDNREEIDSRVINACIGPITELLSLQSLEGLKYIIKALVAITDQRRVLITELYKYEIGTLIISFLTNDQLVEPCLNLIANMTASNMSDVNKLLEWGLIDALTALLSTSHVATVFNVLSELIESRVPSMLDLFDASFISNTVEMYNEGDYEIKKSTAYFLATLIIFKPQSELEGFVCIEICDIIEAMLGCGHGLIVLRCLDALIKLVHVAAQNSESQEFMENLASEDMRGILDNIMQADSQLMSERATYLLDIITVGIPS